MHSLSILYSDESHIQSLRSRPKDFQNVLNRLSQLRTFAETTSNNINRGEMQLSEYRAHMQISQRYLEQLQPWIEQTEIYLKKCFDQIGCSNIHEAKQFLDKHRVNQVFFFLIF